MLQQPLRLNRLRRWRKLSFLVILSLLMQMLLPFGSLRAVSAAEVSGTDLPYLTGFTVTDTSGNPFPGEGGTVPRDADVRIRYDFTFPDDVKDIETDVLYTMTLPDAILITAPMEIDMTFDGTVIGKVTVGTDNVVSVTFLPIINTFDDERAAWFRIDSQFNKEVVNGTTEIVFELGGGAEVKIPVGFEEVEETADLGMAKSGVYNAADNTITWTLDISPSTTPNQRPLSGVVISDVLPSNQTLINSTVAIAKVGSEDEVDGDFDLTTPGTITYTFNEDINTTAGETYRITFKTTPDLTGLVEDSTAIFKNQGTGEFTDNGEPGDSESNEAEVEITVDHITKSGLYDPTTKTIVWTVTVNNHSQSIANAVITDQIPKGLALDTTSVQLDGIPLTVDTNPSYTLTPEDGNFAGTLVYRFGETPITGPHTLTYTTTVVDAHYHSNDDKTFENSANLDGDGLPEGGHGGGIGVDVPSSLLHKQGVGYNPATRTITWKITVNSNKINITAPVTVTDQIPAGQEYVPGSFTVGGAAPGTGLVYTPAAETGGLYTGTLVYTFPGAVSDTVEITFQTLVTDPNHWAKNSTETYYNSATLEGGNITPSTDTGEQEVKSNVLKKTGISYDYVTRELTWEITVNENAMPMTNAKIVDKIDKNQKFVAGSVQINGVGATLGANNTTPNSYYFDENITVDSNGTLYYNFPATISTKQVITFKTEIMDLSIFETNGIKTLNNTATLTAVEIPGEQTSTDKIDVNNTLVGKSGDYEKGNDYIDWNVVVNQNSLTIEDATLVDEFTPGLELDTGSIQLHKMSIDSATGALTVDGGPLPLTGEDKAANVAYDLATNTLTFSFIETIDSPYQLSFRTNIMEGHGKDTFTNSISLGGLSSTEAATSEEITVNVQSGDGGGSGTRRGSITIHKIDSNTGTSLAGAVYQLIDPFGNIVRESAPTGDNGKTSFTRLSLNVEYKIKEITPPTGYVLVGTEYAFTLKAEPENERYITYEAENTMIKGNLRIWKRDESGHTPLRDATFALFKMDGDNVAEKPILTATTGVNGSAFFADIPYGTYQLRETIPPTGYLPMDPRTVRVSLNGHTQVFTIYNTQIKGNIEIKKVDDSIGGGKPLAGATFKLYAATDTEFKTPLKTAVSGGDDGIATFTDVPFGSYIIKETAAPEGYILNASTTFPVTVSEHGTTVTIAEPAVNTQIKGNIEIKKVDDSTDGGQPLTGATFTLYDATDTEFASPLGTAVSAGDDGIATFTGIPYGNYVIKETAAPEGYLFDPDATFPVTVSEHEATVSAGTVTNTLIRGDIAITKQDGEGNALPGATFKLYAAADTDFENPLKTAVSGATDGIATFTDVPFGDYVIKETAAPDGYLLDPTPIFVSIRENGALVTVEEPVINELIRGSIQITKVAADIDGGKPMVGVVFNLYAADDTEFETILDSATTGEDGIVTFADLPYGDYVVKEMSTLTGFVLNAQAHAFAIRVDGDVLKETVVNHAIRGNIKIVKESGDHVNLPLPNVEFTLYQKGDTAFAHPVAVAKTDLSGTATFLNIPFGDYVIKETQAHTGYVQNNGVWEVSIVEDGATILMPVVKNYLIRGGIEILKVSAATGKGLAGAVFTLYDADDTGFSNPLSTATSDNSGKAVFANLPYGDYVVKETKAPSGYLLNNGYWEFSIANNGEVLKAKVTNKAVSPDGSDKDKDKDKDKENGKNPDQGNGTGGGSKDGGKLPKTGESLPILSMILGFALVLFGTALWLRERRKTAKAK